MTWVLIELTPKSIVFCLFFSFFSSFEAAGQESRQVSGVPACSAMRAGMAADGTKACMVETVHAGHTLGVNMIVIWQVKPAEMCPGGLY